MEWPLDLPDAFSDCRFVNTPEELIKVLRSHPDEHIVLFFEWASQDHLWSARYHDYLAVIFKWINHEFLANRFALSHARRIASAFHRHYSVLQRCFLYDLCFYAEGQGVNGNSLMYGAASTSFLQFIRKEVSSRRKSIEGRTTILLRQISFVALERLNEYIHRGSIQKLAQLGIRDFLDLLHQAVLWELKPLAEMCAQALKRYLTQENLLEILITAQRESLPQLKQQVFDFIAEHYSDLAFHETPDGDLILEVFSLTESGKKMIGVLSPWIRYLVCSSVALQDEKMIDIVQMCSSLRGIDFSNSERVNSMVLKALHGLTELRLRHCPWVTEQILGLFVIQLPHITILNIADNEQLDHRYIIEISSWRDLRVLDLTNCHGIGDGDLLQIAVKCVNIIEIILINVWRISDIGVINLARLCPRLISLDLSGCHGITKEGFIALAESAPQLVTLNLRRCRGVSDDVIVEITQLCLDLRSLDISSCPISSPKLLKEIEMKYPYLNLKWK